MILTPGSTSVSLDVQIVDDAGLPVTGLVAATFPTVYYATERTAAVAITLADLSLITSAYSSGGVKERAAGYYRLDVPNAAFASATRVTVYGEATGKRVVPVRVDVANVPADLKAWLGGAPAALAGNLVQVDVEALSGGGVDQLVDLASGNVVVPATDATGNALATYAQVADVDQYAVLPELNSQLTTLGGVKAVRAVGPLVTTSGLSIPTVADIWSAGTRSLTTFGTLAADVATTVWAFATRTLSAFGFTVNTNANATETTIAADALAAKNSAATAATQATTAATQATTAATSSATAATNTTSLPGMITAGKFTTAALSNAPTGGGGGSGGAAGSGADTCSLTITDSGTALPVADADVWIATDANGANVVAGTLQTNSIGKVTFLLDAGVTYYLFMQKDGVNPILGQAFTAEAD